MSKHRNSTALSAGQEHGQEQRVAATPLANACPETDKSAAELLRLIAFDPNNMYFCDQHQVAHIAFAKASPESHHETWPVQSQQTKRWLIGICLRKTQQVPTEKNVNDTLRVMEALAFEAGTRELHNRFAWHEGALWLDMADPLWRTIRITQEGWTIERRPMPIFHRYLHQKALVEPTAGGQLRSLLEFLPPMSQEDELLCLTWTVLACIPTIVRPILLFIGHQGAAKSSACRRLRALIDPSRVPLLGEDKRRDLNITLFKHAVPAFDDLGQISHRTANFFCRAVTGGGTYRRELFTDTNEIILDFRRVILLNAIRLPSNRPDFLDRSIKLHVKRLTTHRPEEELDRKFALAMPQILGALLDVLVRALKLVGGMSGGANFRMADFARYGRAVTVAMNRKAEEFDAAYTNAQNSQAKELVEQDPVAIAVVKLLTEKALPWTVRADDLYPELNAIAKDHELFGQRWPGGKSSMSARLEELIPTLLTLGIKVTKLQRTNRIRSQWKIEKAKDVIVTY